MDQKRIGELEHKINTDYGNTTGVVVLKEGKLVYEKYFNGCTRESQVHVYSVTKSIISILIGIAVDKGYIQSIDQKVLDFFPEYVVRKRENTIQNVTVKDMLTMTAPYKYRFFALYEFPMEKINFHLQTQIPTALLLLLIFLKKYPGQSEVHIGMFRSFPGPLAGPEKISPNPHW